MLSPVLARHLIPSRQLEQRLRRGYISTPIEELNVLVEGFPRGAITEITGASSSGRTTVVQSLLAAATNQGEVCVIVDAADSFDPHSAAAAGADLTRLLWVRCGGNAEDAIRCADLLIHAGGWGAVVVDLADVAAATLRRVPISWWYRFRRAIENTPTAMIVVEREPYAKACASLALDMAAARPVWSGAHADFRVLAGARIELRSKKPVRSEAAVFQARATA